MRKLNCPQSLLDSVDDVAATLISKSRIGLRAAIVDSPTFFERYETKIFGIPSDKQSLIRLSILSWYVPEEMRAILQLEVLDKIESRSEDFLEIKFFLHSFPVMRLYLLDSQKWSTQTFFGNILNEKECLRLLNRLDWKKRKPNKKVRYPQMKRGYDDKGHLKPITKWKPSSDYTLTELNNERENRQQSLEDSIQFAIGFMT